MRLALPLALAIAAGCSSSGTHRPTDAAATPQTVHVAGAGTVGQASAASVRVTSANDVAADTIAAPLDSVWKALPAVYNALGIEVNLLDPQLRTIGTSGTKLYRRLGQTALRRLLDCGSTQLGPNADSYEVLLAATSTARKVDSTTTILVTNVQATARPMQFASGESICRTRGELEKQVALLIRTRVLPP